MRKIALPSYTCVINIDSFRNINPLMIDHFYYLEFIKAVILKSLWIMFILFMKNSSNKYYHAKNFSHFSRGNLSSKLNLIFIYFSSYSFQFLVIDLIKLLILIHRSLYFLIFSLLSLVATSVEYLFLLFFANVDNMA